MKKTLLTKMMLLLCALVAGSSSVWADVVTFDATKDVDADAAAYQTSEKTYTATDGSTWVANGYGATKETSLTIGKGGANYLLTPSVSGTISSVAVTWSGNTSYYLALQTIDGTELSAKSNTSSSSTQTFSVTGSYSQLKLVGRRSSGTSNAAAVITKVVVTYTAGGGPTTYSVIYDGNGATSGDVPTDATAYSSGALVTVKGNIGGLAKPSFTFAGWNTKSDGTGTNYSAGNTFSITANTTLYAQWVFAVTDGIFDFVNASKQEPLVDYDSGVTLSSGAYTTDSKTWTAGNVTMVTSKVSGSGYRWWSADGTLRFYNESKATISVPDGYVITKIVTTGSSFNSANVGTLSSSTWTGASKSVELSATASKNINSITVTYGTTVPVTITAAGWASYSCGVALDFTGTAVTAYIAKEKDASSVTLSPIAKVPAETGIVVSAAAADTYDIPVLSSAADATTGNLLKPNLKPQVLTSSYYTLAVDGESKPIFKKSSGSGTLAAGKAYLDLTGSAPTLSIDFGEGETTSLREMRNEELEMRNAEIYNLAGQRVATPTKGLYIVNGKKVIIK